MQNSFCDVVLERRVLEKRCGSLAVGGNTCDFGLGATGPRLLAPLGPLKALACTGPTVEKAAIVVTKLHQ